MTDFNTKKSRKPWVRGNIGGFFTSLLEGGAKVIDAYKKSGLPLTFGKEKKAQIRRRQNFCKVINGDLLTLAKAENWNDQYFTDLEAEVEAEGGYYATLLDKMRKRPSQGLRKVSSLISAIELSTETALLIVGQPGSGKSVALRHLGHQFAERAIKSDDPETLIPLYINLKELDATQGAEINADLIKQFILDNIRRGDADTAAYVKDHWNDYRERGIWFFLFDSFDEIPEVLHAPTESNVIRQYAEAIRQFLEGMSSCRGVLASREFKGPNALSWQKIRILPLSEDRQEQLIENSFLEPNQKSIVHLHMASNKSSLRNNPLFLTLLCRYVKDNNQPPINDHDLLSGHIDRLARRDEDYIQRKYGLTSGQLIEGAIKIAVLFAENKNLSLAPTQTEIAAELPSKFIPGGNLENMLSALQDVKIGRSDVQEARAGDRRFTFSHRRYQETLFVRHLARTVNYLTPYELLTDTRWREYSVTLLQTQDLATIEPMMIEAARLIEEYAVNSVKVSIIQELGGNLEYFNWKDDPAVSLLSILQEGLERRLNDIPEILSYKIGELLCPRWTQGDRYDQMMVIKYGGLLPQHLLSEYIGLAIEYGGIEMESIAFQRIVFLNPIPDTVANWLRMRLSHEAIGIKKQADILRLEALAARLPDAIGAKYIIGRCCLLNRLRRPIGFVRSILLNHLSPSIDTIINRARLFSTTELDPLVLKNVKRIRLLNLIMDFVTLFSLIPILFLCFIIGYINDQMCTNTLTDKTEIGVIYDIAINSEHLASYGFLAIVYIIILIYIASLIGFRSVGSEINTSYIFGCLTGW
ncbi:NACHT domain-containing NTPase [Methylomonas sp. DH-1]|uniref:NACHT domain-containing protein n=1 Tax=Methylomonas sp. (strain DH-1) TaxID=1727196 RepID=UPI000AD7F8D6|nr:NACHT domain-containing protein [Methylomonas sp. DH-1]